MKKKFFKLFILPWFRWIAYLFYDKKYLTGKYFQPSNPEGWSWVLNGIWKQKILGFNRHLPFPCAPTARVFDHKNIFFHPDNLDNFQSPGIYFDCVRAKIYIGEGTLIGPNVGLLTANHNLYNFDHYDIGKDIILGKNCWLGMGVIILPGVQLGDRTIVGAGTVVTRSFPEGHCILGGVPARVLKSLEQKSC